MRIDKTYSELWNLVNTHDDETLKETAKMAINALQKIQEENQWLYGKLNQINEIIERGRIESSKF